MGIGVLRSNIMVAALGSDEPRASSRALEMANSTHGRSLNFSNMSSSQRKALAKLSGQQRTRATARREFALTPPTSILTLPTMAPKKAAPPSSTGKQSTLLGFFSKTPSSSNVNAHANAPPSSSPSQQPRRSNSASSAPKVVPAKNKAASPPSSSGNGSADAGPSKRAKRDEGRKLETVGEDEVEAGGGDGQGDVTVHGDATMEVDGEDGFPVVSSVSLAHLYPYERLERTKAKKQRTS
jgi:hypothetical protein